LGDVRLDQLGGESDAPVPAIHVGARLGQDIQGFLAPEIHADFLEQAGRQAMDDFDVIVTDNLDRSIGIDDLPSRQSGYAFGCPFASTDPRSTCHPISPISFSTGSNC
jgi:hypothetical protein